VNGSEPYRFDIDSEKHLAIVHGATHLFEEPGTLQEAARLASHWFRRCLGQKGEV
jgi:putative phosphoribosyl transferase